jgi:hypothetical protein
VEEEGKDGLPGAYLTLLHEGLVEEESLLET